MSEPSVSAVAGLVAFMCIFALRYYSKIQCGHLNPFAGIISLSLISLKDYVFHLLFWRNVYVQYIISFSYLSCIYIYIQINFNETSTIDTHQKCRTPLSFIPVWVLRRGESTASQTQLRDCTRPGPPTVGVGVQQWTRFFFLIHIP